MSISEESFAIAGYTDYTLHCTASGEPGLSSRVMYSVQWFNPNGYEITGGNFTISDYASGNSVNSSLKFNSLRTSQAGRYTCMVSISVPLVEVVNYTLYENIDVIVKCKFL